MNIAIDISPLKSGHYLQHRVRGTGFYLQNLRASLEKYYPENKYVYFTRGERVEGNPDVVHYPYFEPFFLTLPIFSKYKKIVTVHDLTPLVFPEHFKAGLKGSLKWLIQKQAMLSCERVITDSESSKNDITKFTGVDPGKIKVVYLAAGQEFEVLKDQNKKEEVIKKFKLPNKFALYVGDATWNKNLPRLIEASVKSKTFLVMVGKALLNEQIDHSNPWNKDLSLVQKLAKENSNIIRLGFVSSEDLVALYNAATLFVMPSIYEGFGLPILEAMNCGCPVVASKGGSLAEIVGDAGLFVDSYDLDSISKGIKAVFEDQGLREKMSAKGLEQAKKFTWKKTADETMRVYESVV